MSVCLSWYRWKPNLDSGGDRNQIKKKRFDIIPQRNSANLENFTINHILPGTHITHHGWAGYNFWGDDELVCTEEIHHHGGGDFGEGEYSTSHIEHSWAQMKSKIKSI